jgi:hypothetical protein
MNDRQRLEAIVGVVCKYLPPGGTPIKEAMSQIIALVDPLPEPVQEPVAELMHEPDVEVLRQQMKGRAQFLRDRGEVKTPQLLEIASELITPPAAQPAAWVGLTADEMLEALIAVDPATKRLPIGFARFAQAIEAKLKEKNT